MHKLSIFSNVEILVVEMNADSDQSAVDVNANMGALSKSERKLL